MSQFLKTFQTYLHVNNHIIFIIKKLFLVIYHLTI